MFTARCCWFLKTLIEPNWPLHFDTGTHLTSKSSGKSPGFTKWENIVLHVPSMFGYSIPWQAITAVPSKYLCRKWHIYIYVYIWTYLDSKFLLTQLMLRFLWHLMKSISQTGILFRIVWNSCCSLSRGCRVNLETRVWTWMFPIYIPFTHLESKVYPV